MNRKKNIFKRFLVTVMASIMMLSMTPQLPILNNVSTVSAAKIKISKKKLTLKVGKTKKLTLKNASGKVQWKSSNKKIATVSQKGLVKAKRQGKATITAVYKNKNYKCVVTVKAAATSNTAANSSSDTSDSSDASDSSQTITQTVYWVPSGSVYHVSENCPTLARSKTILSGTIANSGKPRACKVCSK